MQSGFVQRSENLPEILQPSLEILDDLCGRRIRIGQIFQISEALVLDPGDVQAGFVTCRDFIISEPAPTVFGIGLGVPALLQNPGGTLICRLEWALFFF